MEYQGFVVEAFERDPGKWRAKICRSSGTPVITGRKRIFRFVTGADATTAPAALLMALEAIEAGAFSRARRLPEKFWRHNDHGKNGNGGAQGELAAGQSKKAPRRAAGAKSDF